ncbi:transmembrane protein 56-B-like [Sinocyclocheilus grahami]|uniref:transmembrane protein 56-B-like n=1 Tax=Sinocyclocheilus grahami TaxID=75366 RepID=UPI0007AD30AB|nr:PREDICTED: transmembrane protein 56-B-like [Sinocyclocheilus grahami]
MDVREVYVVAGSFVGFQLFFKCVSPVLSSNFTQGYGKLPPNKLNDWNSRLVSTVHALIVGLFCLYILWYDDAVNEDPICFMFFIFFQTRGVLPYFANFRLISELSTPFVNQRWFFEALAYPRTHPLVVTNGVAMAVVFFLVRIAVMPPYWAKVFGTFGTPAFERLGLAAQVAWIVSCVCLDILNTIWMYKIARGCYKVITGKLRGGKVDSKKTNYMNNHTD